MIFFFFNDTATTEIYTLSLHDALPISDRLRRTPRSWCRRSRPAERCSDLRCRDRKSTRLNSSHSQISYAVFCLKKHPTAPPNTLKRPSHEPQPPLTRKIIQYTRPITCH